MHNETRFRMVEKLDPERFRRLAEGAVLDSARRIATYQHMAKLIMPIAGAGGNGNGFRN
jgi:hypothetical protein